MDERLSIDPEACLSASRNTFNLSSLLFVSRFGIPLRHLSSSLLLSLVPPPIPDPFVPPSSTTVTENACELVRLHPWPTSRSYLPLPWQAFDVFVDVLFMLDICLSFVTCYEDQVSARTRPMTRADIQAKGGMETRT